MTLRFLIFFQLQIQLTVIISNSRRFINDIFNIFLFFLKKYGRKLKIFLPIPSSR